MYAYMYINLGVGFHSPHTGSTGRWSEEPRTYMSPSSNTVRVCMYTWRVHHAMPVCMSCRASPHPHPPQPRVDSPRPISRLIHPHPSIHPSPAQPPPAEKPTTPHHITSASAVVGIVRYASRHMRVLASPCPPCRVVLALSCRVASFPRLTWSLPTYVHTYMLYLSCNSFFLFTYLTQ